MADTFTVTSKADSGPGTLRDALTQAAANGSGTTDFIVFNIADNSMAGRMIDLSSELPDVSSNLVIDGSTQPGSPFAVTDAKIFVRKMDYAYSFSMLKLHNVSNVKIYGLYLFWGYWEYIFSGPAVSDKLYAIDLSNAFNIEIGAPGKGNVINGFLAGIHAGNTNDSCRNVRIQSNFIGQGMYYDNPALDISDVVVSPEAGIAMSNVRDCTIGGPSAAYGNVITAKRAIDMDSRYATGNGFITVQFNHFCRGYDKQTLMRKVDFWNYNINIGSSRYLLNWAVAGQKDYKVQILDNDIPTHLNLTGVSEYFTIQGNHFEDDQRNSNQEFKLAVTLCPAGGIIGSEDPSRVNTFRYRNPISTYNYKSVFVGDVGPVTVVKNQFQCNSIYGSTTVVSSSQVPYAVPFAQINATTSGSVTGTATNDCRIDLYYDDECTACEGKIYIGQASSDGAGRWQYNGPVNGTVVATATDATGRTGEFSAPRFYTTAVKIIQPTCGKANGSIRGITSDGAERFYWQELTTGAIVSNSIDLENAGPGEYLLFGVHGGTCIKPIYQSIDLADVTPHILASNAYITQPGCGRFNGSITNISVTGSTNIKYFWINDQGQTVSNQSWLSNAGPGKYKFMIMDTVTGCSDETGYYELVNQSGPSIDINQASITGTTCRRPTGGISHIQITNITGQPSYAWKDAAGHTVATTPDLINVPPGVYHLDFKDQGGCDLISTPDLQIPNTGGDILLSVDKMTAVPETCERGNASVQIQHISPTDAGFSFSWIDSSSGQVIGSGMSIGGLHTGTYYFQATDAYSCVQRVDSFQLADYPAPQIDQAAAVVTPDVCSQQRGAISGIKIQGSAPLAYSWYDDKGDIISSDKDLSKAGAGNYFLVVKDNNNCSTTGQVIAIGNTIETLTAPVYDNATVAKGNTATLDIRQHDDVTYELYSMNAGGPAAIPDQQNGSGNFTTGQIFTDTTVFVRSRKGDCTSPFTAIDITALSTMKLLLPNAFTPNGDGHNDVFSVKNPGLVRTFSMTIFNRWGQQIFVTKDPYKGWDGKFKGLPASPGAYVWNIQYTDILGDTRTREGTVMLIR